MIWYKSCPKCGKGDLMLERDLVGFYRQCLQCGYMQDLAMEQTTNASTVLVNVKPLQRPVRRAEAA